MTTLLALLAYAATIALAYAIYRALCLITWSSLGAACGAYSFVRDSHGRIYSALFTVGVMFILALSLVVADTIQRPRRYEWEVKRSE